MSRQSEASLWGELVVLDPTFDLRQATEQLKDALKRLGRSEALCLCAHGNNEEIGDEDPRGWGWSAATMATILGGKTGYGPILIRACANDVVTFATNLAAELDRQKLLNGTWIYGYQHAVLIEAKYPDPKKLDKNVELYARLVSFRAAAQDSGSQGALPYQIALPHGGMLQVHPGFDARELATLLAVLTPASALAARSAEVTKLTTLDVRSAANTQVLTGPNGEYDEEKGTLWVNLEGSQELNGGPQAGDTYTITFAEAGSPKTLKFKGRFAGVGYEFEP